MIDIIRTLDISKEDFLTANKIVKKSKFITYIYNVESEKEAKKIIFNICESNKDAKHNVYAYRIIEDNNIIERYSDDGEPLKTAGFPILNLIKQKEIDNVLIIVSRYFGGILLGTGLLYNTYLDCALNIINNCKIIEKYISEKYNLEVSYDKFNEIKRLFEKKSKIFNITYGDNITFEIAILSNFITKFEEYIQINSIKNVKKERERLYI